LKTYYELLGVARDVSPDEIKRAFRKENARYHPDKVQHLGPEFQEIAATRAAELTEAYRILMDEAQRQRYDATLESGAPAPAVSQPAARPQPTPETPGTTPASAPPIEPPPAERRFQQGQSTTDFVRKAALAKLREAIADVTSGTTEASPGRAADAAFALKGKGGFFRKAEPPVRLIAKIVPQVDPPAVAEAWSLGLGAANGDETVCILLLGSGLAPARDLAAAVAEQRRKTRKAAPVLVPVDVRDWEALFPPEAPVAVRAILQRLRDGKV
jgi:hypothetical protein